MLGTCAGYTLGLNAVSPTLPAEGLAESGPAPGALPAPPAKAPAAPTSMGGQIAAYMHLSKFRLCLLVVFSEAAAFLVARPLQREWMLFAVAAFGTLASAMGANALNQFVERERDARMFRTMNRPLPSGKLTPSQALGWGLAASLFGVGVLWFTVNWLAGALAALTIVTYVLAYTPLKPASASNTLAGAVVGALPPMIGWAAARGGLDPGAFIVATILFLWQVPHFLSLAWMYRDDYKRGGFVMLPSVASPVVTARVALIYAVALIPIGLLPTLVGISTWAYGIVALCAGLYLTQAAITFAIAQTNPAARKLFISSLLYLPVVLAAMVALPQAPAKDSGAQWRVIEHGAPPPTGRLGLDS